VGTSTIFHSILSALCERDPTLPNLDELCFYSIDLTAENFAHLLAACRPNCFEFKRSAILISPTFPTNTAAMDQVKRALQGTSTTMKSIAVSALDGSDICLRAILQGVGNHEELTTAVEGRINGILSELTQNNANALVEFLHQSTGEFKRLVLSGFLCNGNPAFISVAEAFRDSSSHRELELAWCKFDFESSRHFGSIFSSRNVEKEITLDMYVVFSRRANVLETLAGSSPGLVRIGVKTHRTIDLKAIFRGLAKRTCGVLQKNSML
jgi:hypothetical protein